MKKCAKTWLSVCLSVAMILALLPAVVFAAGDDGQVQEISFVPTDTEYSRDGGYVFLEGDGEVAYGEGDAEYYIYDFPGFTDGDTLIVDGVSYVLEYIDDEPYFVNESDPDDTIYAWDLEYDFGEQTYEHYWTPETTDAVCTFTYMGATCTVPVTIEPNPVTEISYQLAEGHVLIEGVDGTEQTGTDEDGVEHQWFWYEMSPAEGDKLTVVKSGETLVYEYKWTNDDSYMMFVNENYEFDTIDADDLSWIYNQGYDNQWEIGENSITLRYSGRECEVKISVVSNPVKAISYEPAESLVMMEGIDAQEAVDWDDDGNELHYQRYDIRSQVGDKLTVTTDSGDMVYEYTFVIDQQDEGGSTLSHGCYVNVNDEQDRIEDYDWESDQGYDNEWTVGDHFFTFKYMGRTCQIPVVIAPNPVTAIEYVPVEPVELMEGRDGYYRDWTDEGEEVERWYCYHYNWRIGDKLIVTNTDYEDPIVYEYQLTSEEDDSYEFVNAKDPADRLENCRIDSDQSPDNTWKVGEDHSFTITYKMRTCQLPVTIVEYVPDPETPDGFAYQIADGKATITGYNGEGGKVEIPESIEEAPVTAIGGDAFIHKGLTEVVIPESVTSIGSGAFASNEKLTKINIPESVTALERSVFYGCGFTEFTVPGNVKMIKYGAFLNCRNLKKAVFEEGVEVISNEAFNLCPLEEVSFPEGLKKIGGLAFDSCPLKEVTIPGSVQEIGSMAFITCPKLETVTIMPGVTSISDNAFAACPKLKNISLPDTIAQVGYGAFHDCAADAQAYYCGSEDEWDRVMIAEGNDVLTNNRPYLHSPDMDVVKATLTEDGSMHIFCRVCRQDLGDQMIPHPETVKLSKTTYTYTGKAIKPAVTATDALGNPMTGLYTVKYASNIKAGTAKAVVTFNPTYYDAQKEFSFKIVKAANPMTAKGKAVTLKAAMLKKKNQTITKTKAFTIKKAQGTVKFKLVSVAKSKFKKYFSVSSAGKITVKKGLKKGTYKVKVNVTAAGNSNYKAKTVKNVTVTVKVK